MRHQRYITIGILMALYFMALHTEQSPLEKFIRAATVTDESYGCIAFSPYVTGYYETGNSYPDSTLVDQLLDNIVNQTMFRCIQTYHSTYGMNYTFQAAKDRGLQVIAVIWLNDPPADNTAMIQNAIDIIKQYNDTVIAISCGSELVLRNGAAAEPVIMTCINMIKEVGLEQPVTANDVPQSFCGYGSTCQPSDVSKNLDYIGVNLYPWWANEFGTCTSVTQSPNVQLSNYNYMRASFSNTTIVVSEWGWPAGPNGYRLINNYSKQPCTGIAGELYQDWFLLKSLQIFREHRIPSVLFESFREPWKTSEESAEGAYWGICEPNPPYNCKAIYEMNITTISSYMNCKQSCAGECYDPKYYNCTAQNTLEIISLPVSAYDKSNPTPVFSFPAFSSKINTDPATHHTDSSGNILKSPLNSLIILLLFLLHVILMI